MYNECNSTLLKRIAFWRPTRQRLFGLSETKLHVMYERARTHNIILYYGTVLYFFASYMYLARVSGQCSIIWAIKKRKFSLHFLVSVYSFGLALALRFWVHAFSCAYVLYNIWLEAKSIQTKRCNRVNL